MNTLQFKLFAAIITLAFGAPAAAVEIRLKSEAHSPGSLVRLGDIAEIEGLASAADASLADLVLFPAPAVGKTRELGRQELRQLLALCDVEVRGVELTGAERVVIHAGGDDSKTIIRPALHLIPASAYIKPGTSKPGAKTETAKSAAAPAPSKLVGRNQVVSIHSIWPGVKVTATGKALADGALGESVLVEQGDTRERVLAKVIGPQTVEIRPTAK
jgi:hypothetical protein